MDRLTQERRSWLMSHVKSQDTLPEIRVRRVAHALGYRFRLHRRDLPGKPDIVFPKLHVALFVHGCFWHRHPGCPKAGMPKSKVDFWRVKFERNIERDKANVAALEKLGWTVAVIWECETRNPDRLRKIVQATLANARSPDPQPKTVGVL